MSAFLYYLPGVETPYDPQRLKEAGLRHAFDHTPHNQDGPGPDDGRGMLLCDAERLSPYQPQYRPDDQAWRQIPGSTAWIGYYTAALPVLEALARPVQIEGYRVTLGRDQGAQVPLVRLTEDDGSSGSALESYLELDDSGQLKKGSVVESQQWLWDLTEAYWRAWREAINETLERVAALGHDATKDEVRAAARVLFEYPKLAEDSARVLGVNYRVSLVECSLLRLFTTHKGSAEVLSAACDCDRAVYVLQKKTGVAERLAAAFDTRLGDAA